MKVPVFLILIVVAAIGSEIDQAYQQPQLDRQRRCYQGCVDTYSKDTDAGAAERLANCTDRCEGE